MIKNNKNVDLEQTHQSKTRMFFSKNINSIRLATKSFEFRMEDYLQLFFFGFKCTLMGKIFKSIFLKHLFYLIQSSFFNYEYLLAILTSIFRVFYLIMLVSFDWSVIKNWANKSLNRESQNRNKYFNVILIGSELMLLAVLGLNQLLNKMNVWDFRRRIQSELLFYWEISQFSTELVFTILCFVFYLFKNNKI